MERGRETRRGEQRWEGREEGGRRWEERVGMRRRREGRNKWATMVKSNKEGIGSYIQCSAIKAQYLPAIVISSFSSGTTSIWYMPFLSPILIMSGKHTQTQRVAQA